MADVPFRDPTDRSSRVYPFDGDLQNPIYELGTADAYITGSIRYVLTVRDFFFKPERNTSGGGGGGNPNLIPVMQLSADSLVFPDTDIYQTSPEQELTVQNVGTAPLIITELNITTLFEFSVVPALPITLAPNALTTLKLVFKPIVEGPITGTLTLISNALTSPRFVSLSGLALALTPIPEPPAVWTFLGGYLQWARSSAMQIQLPALQANDLAIICMTYRGGNRWTIPAGWEVPYEQNDGMVTPNGTASMLIMYRVIQAGDPLGFTMVPRLGPQAIEVTNALCIGWRPKNGVPRFAGLSDQKVNGETTFETPSINVPNPNSLIHCMMGTGSYEDWYLGLKPFVANGLAALPSFPMSPYGQPPSDGLWRWQHLSHASTTSPFLVSHESYGLQPVPAGPTGKFVGQAISRGNHRLVALVFDGPTE